MTSTHDSDCRPRFGSLPDQHMTRPFCGPAILAIVSGIDVSEIVRLILRCRGLRGYSALDRKRISGMGLSELIGICEDELNLLCVNVPVRENPNWKTFKNDYSQRCPSPFPTFAQWLKDSAPHRGNDVYLILTTSHYLLVCGNKIVDNMLRFPRILSTIRKYKQSRVIYSYCIMKP